MADHDDKTADLDEAAAGQNGTESLSMDEVLKNTQADLTEAQQDLLRCQADLDNFRKRASRELADERRYATIPLLRDLLQVRDNIERAIEAAKKSEGGGGLLEGFQMVFQQFNNVLQQHNCVEIEAQNASFDPNLHQAISSQPATDVEPGTVTNVVQPGFRVYDRVVRPAMVIVATPPEES